MLGATDSEYGERVLGPDDSLRGAVQCSEHDKPLDVVCVARSCNDPVPLPVCEACLDSGDHAGHAIQSLTPEVIPAIRSDAEKRLRTDHRLLLQVRSLVAPLLTQASEAMTQLDGASCVCVDLHFVMLTCVCVHSLGVGGQGAGV